MHAYTKAWRAMSDMGFEKGNDGTWVQKDAPTVGDVHVNRPLGGKKRKDDPGTDEPDVEEFEEEAEALKADPPAVIPPAHPATSANPPAPAATAPPGLAAAKGVPRCGNCAHYDGTGHCLMYGNYPVNAGQVCSTWQAKTVTKLFVPPVEVQAAAKLTDYDIDGITSALAKGEGVDADRIRQIANFFSGDLIDMASVNTRNAWGGAHAAKWAARVIKKLAAPANAVEKADIDFEIEGTIVKVDQQEHLVFGWFSIVEVNGRPIEDTQGDMITPATIEASAYDFVLNARTGGEMHEPGADGEIRGVGRLVESCVFTTDKVNAMVESLRKQGIEATIDLRCIPWWGGMKIDDPDTWAQIVTGDLRAWSIGGKGKRAAIST
jgi:hypothetical protein